MLTIKKLESRLEKIRREDSIVFIGITEERYIGGFRSGVIVSRYRSSE